MSSARAASTVLRPWHARTVDGRRYRLVVAGVLGPRYRDAFDGMTVEPGLTTTDIVGDVRDQAHLHGLFERIGSLGLTIVSVSGENGRNACAD